MAALSPAAVDVVRRHHGIITTSQLREAEISAKAIRTLAGSGLLVREHRGVYRIATSPVTLESRCVALCCAHESGFITGPSGGRLWGLRRMPNDRRLYFAAPHGIEFDHLGIVLRQTTAIDPSDVFVRTDGIRVASPWRLAFDLAADLKPLDHASVVEQILHEGRCNLNALVDIAHRLARTSRPGSRLFVTTLAGRLPGDPLESHAEVRLAMPLRARGVPVTSQATWLDLPNGSRARLDLSVPEIRWGIEVDVHPDHLLLDGTTKDRRRDRQAHLLGWQIDRVTALDLLVIDDLLDELVEIYRRRCVALRLESSI